MEIEESLIKMNSFEAIRDVLHGVKLHPLQCIDVMKMLYRKKALVSYDTGTGKTLLYSAVMSLLWMEDPSRRFIIFVLKDQLQQTPKKVETWTQRSVIVSAADVKNLSNLLEGGKFLNYPVLMLTHECLRNHEMMKILWRLNGQYYGVFIDEAHRLSNRNFAQGADVLAGVCSKFEYSIALTATPFTTNVKQLAKLANVVDNKRYENYERLARALLKGSFRVEDDPLFFINRSGKELGRNSEYVGRILWVQAMPHQTEELGGNALMEVCKGDGATAQAEALVHLCKEYGDRRGLVYVNQHAVREFVLPYFDKAGIRYRCINGYTKAEERERIMHEFNEEGACDVVITSVTTAIDLDCDYVVFYEFTTYLKQMIGRADRGLDGKTLDIWYILTKGSFEVPYFYNHIVLRSELVASILSKEIREVETVADEIEQEVILGA